MAKFYKKPYKTSTIARNGLLGGTSPVGKKMLIYVLLIGFTLGALGGFLFMGTIHALIEVGSFGSTISTSSKKNNSKTDSLTLDDKQVIDLAASLGRRSGSADVDTLKDSDVQKWTESEVPDDYNEENDSSNSGFEWTEEEQDTVHVLMTSGGGPYQDFQSRIAYRTFLKVQKQHPDLGPKMVAFTRILHRNKDDELMEEIPTFRATISDPNCDTWCDYPVGSRPSAVAQFFAKAKADPAKMLIKAPWIFMTETDYVWIRPLPAPGRANDPSIRPISFPFGYISPTWPTVEPIMKRFYKGNATDIPGTGPAPAVMRVEEWLTVLPEWQRLTQAFDEDAEANKEFGWVREMYAFSLACAIKMVKVDLPAPPRSPLMAQPPADHLPGDAAVLHYTWGSIFHQGGKDGPEIWRFDKRDYSAPEFVMNPPMFPLPPPYESGWTLQDDVAITRELHSTMTRMLQIMNNAIKEMNPNATYLKMPGGIVLEEEGGR
jgi:hydroxyproline O-arabinosyltransferase